MLKSLTTIVAKAGLLVCLIWICQGHALQVAEAKTALSLTPEEKAWLLEHDGKIRLSPAPDWEPMEFFDANGKYSGVIADYIGLIEERLNFHFKVVRTGSWSETLAKAKNKEIDIIPAAQPTLNRRQYMIWSKPYFHVNTTIIVRKEFKQQFSLGKMAGMRIGVPKDYAVGIFVRETYPNLTLIAVDTNKEGLTKVSFGELDALITEIPNALYVIEKEKITNLRLAGDTGFQLDLGIGIRNDIPFLPKIIEKVLADISESEHKAIYSKWLHLETEPFYRNQTFWLSVGTIFALVSMLIGTVVTWNRTLHRKVRHRTEAIRFNEMRMDALLQLNERPNDSIQEIVEFAFEQMIRLTKSRFGYLAFDDQEGMIYSVRSRDAKSRKQPITEATTGFTPETKGLWGKAVLNKEPVISNYYPHSNPKMKGLPEGCRRTLFRYMNVPIFKGDRVVAVAGVGNKSQDYDASDLRQLTLLTQGLWRLLQKKQEEQALARDEKNLRDIVENSPNGITIIQNGKVVFHNTKQLELMGDIDLATSIRYEHIHSEDKKQVKSFFDSILVGSPIKKELDYKFYTSLKKRTRENLRWVTTLITPINYRDDQAFLLTTLDLTRARELEHLLTVNDKMATLGRVAAGIGHEVRNPLSGINIYLHSIEKGLADPDKFHKIGPAIEGIRTASEKMESVVKRVIDFSKPIEPTFMEIDINKPVMEAAELAGMSMKKYNVILTTDLAENLSFCNAEYNLIEEVVLNMINNSVDAMAGQKNPKSIIISTSSDKDHVRIIIEDSGPGVPGDLAEEIFEPFFTTKDYSTGIGLALCNRIIIDHKGRIKVEKSLQGGARFVIELPRCQNSTLYQQSKQTQQ
jgi:signal transduction histidine kinase/ABC-type amino acid transport substrate-binding protein